VDTFPHDSGLEFVYLLLELVYRSRLKTPTLSMISLDQLRCDAEAKSLGQPLYQTLADLNIYDSPALAALATQAGIGRQLSFQSWPSDQPLIALPVVLREDDYPGWLAIADLAHLRAAIAPHPPSNLTAIEIQARIPQVIDFCLAAMAQPNTYLWGGTVGPNYDCSGLIQHSFAAQGIWLPRDAYQQETFTQPIVNPGREPADLISALLPGDLIFFGTPAKATHVAIYLGSGRYIHSSGQSQGRDGIGIDDLAPQGHPVTQTYYAQVRGAGRVMVSYQPS
jgi:NlpC/P60 family/Bacterial dipeptidyl-peptidase Sh3 domain